MDLDSFFSTFPDLKKGYTMSNHKGLIYIRGDVLIYFTDIYKRIIKITEDSCKFDLFTGQPKTDIVAILTDLYDITKISELKTAKYNIMSVGIIKTFSNDFPELYSLCTNVKYRGKGYMKILLQNILKEVPSPIFSLGIDLRNTEFQRVIKIYAQSGFQSIGIRKVTPGGINPGFPFLLMTYNKKINTNYNEEIKKGIDMYEEYTPVGCKISLVISKNVIENIRKHILEDREYAGRLQVLKRDRGNRYRLVVPIESVKKGEMDSVYVEPYYITWHTHPYICYKKNNCFIGWPSGADLRNLILQYHVGSVSHIVFSAEGMYVCSLSKGMMDVVSLISDTDCINTLGELAALVFSKLENYRSVEYDKQRIDCYRRSKMDKESFIKCLSYDSREKNMQLSKVLKILNTTTLSGMIDDAVRLNVDSLLMGKIKLLYDCLNNTKASKNIPVFNISFYNYSSESKETDLYIDLDYLIAPTESRCPIPIEKISGKILI